MTKRKRMASSEHRREVAKRLSNEKSGILREEMGSPLIGLMLQTQALLVLYERLQHGDVPSNLATLETLRVIEFALSETVIRLMSTLEEMRMSTYGLTALQLTTQLEIDVLLDGVSTMRADLTQIYSDD